MDTATATTQLEQLKKFTKVVADTGDFATMKEYEPQDATTNPSLILAAVEMPEYEALLDAAVADRKSSLSGEALIRSITIDLLTRFGCEILKIVPGRVSTEVDARLSFDAEASIAMALEIIELYESRGISRERILIKLASTWEGIKAAEALKKEGIHCNMTLMFELAQAVAADAAGATLISPFVGRIYDWHKKDRGVDDIPLEDDPGVGSVREIFTYLKHFESNVQVMGASFRKTGQIIELAGCDLLTIAPDLLDDLASRDGELTRKLDPADAQAQSVQRIEPDEPTFRWMMCQNPMATDKLAEGIRRFAADLDELRDVVTHQMTEAVKA